MALTLNIAGTAIPTSTPALQGFPQDVDMAFNLGNALATLLDATLANVPSSAATTTVAYASPSASWTPAGGPVTFGLSGGVSGSLNIVTSGTLVSYTDGLDSPQSKTISVPAGVAYVSLTLSFNISANVAGQYTGGAYGVSASAGTEDSYSITWSKAFDPNTTVRAALAQVFESLVLPHSTQTLTKMSDNDYLLYEFDGNLHLSFGAYFGLNQVLYAGQSSIDILQGASSLLGKSAATFTAGANPTIAAGANLNFSYAYTTLFQALLSKANNTARLHLYRSSNATTSTNLTAGLTFDANVTGALAVDTTDVQSGIVTAAGGANSDTGLALNTVLTAGASEIAKYIAEVNDKLSSWLNRANGLKANLELLIETSGSRTILAGYDFNLLSADYPAAWQAAINGDFVAALDTGAVTLDVGSGLESAYQRKTTFNVNFFNLWSFSTWSQFSHQVSLVYAGNNVFHLVANIGRTTQTSSMGAMHSIDFYFAATANVGAGGAISATDIDLHVDLTAQANPKAAATIATLLSAIEAGPAGNAVAQTMNTFASNSPQGTVQLQITISQTAYANIHCDPYDSKGNPLTANSPNDSQNYQEFAKAADDLSAWPLPNLVSGSWLPYMQSFAAWAALNQPINDVPNRLDTFYPIGSWSTNFPDLDSGTQALVINCMLAGQNFMNFCADLVDLYTVANATTVTAGTNWNALVKMLTNAIKNDVDIDFARPTALALIRRCKAPITVAGPNSSAVPSAHFAVNLTL